MKIKASFVLGCMMVFYGAGSLSGASLEGLLGAARAAALAAGEKPTELQFSVPRFRLLPQHERVGQVIEDVHQELDPEIMVETLRLYTKPAGAAKPAWSETERTQLFNGVLALSTLAGLQYYSASRRTMRTFYETSGIIDGPASKTFVADPVYPVPPGRLTIYARHEDLTFGDNTYQYDYYSFPDAMVFVQQNLSSLTYGIIPAVGKNRLRSAVAIIDAG
ncbi:MAG: hypothetical protein LBQ67_01340, partial [Treponema sp.]|nr:hypothetical protein [Treponema sp.]